MKLFGHHVYLPILLLVALEFGVAWLAFGITVAILRVSDVAFVEAGPHWLWGVCFSAAVTIGMTAVGLYHPKQRLRIEGTIARIVVGSGIAMVILALAQFVFSVGLGRLVWALSLGMAFVLLAFARVMLWRWIDHDMFRRRILVYGAGSRAASMLKLRRASDRRGFNIVAFVPAPGDTALMEDPRVASITGSLRDYALGHHVDEIVVAMDDRRLGFPVGDLLQCKFEGIAVVDLLSFLERETGRVKVDLVNPGWLIFSEGFEARLGLRVATRMLDFLTAGVLAALTAPIMLVVAAAILIETGRPILYRQRRVGWMGEVFTLYKFRSMIKNAEASGVPQWAGHQDDRVTRVGGILRKLRLDELPQLLNVLRGDMSIVGPRPERPEFVERLSVEIPYYHERHSVKPGITGWAQLSYPYGASDHDAMEKLQYDLYYIKHKSLIFDLMVLLQTAEVILWGKGAR
jgi:sugar transferase (PEP-CTERM system associated)